MAAATAAAPSASGRRPPDDAAGEEPASLSSVDKPVFAACVVVQRDDAPPGVVGFEFSYRHFDGALLLNSDGEAAAPGGPLWRGGAGAARGGG